MKRTAHIGIAVLASALVAAGTPDTKTDLKTAAKKLEDASGYSWTSTIKNEGGGTPGGNRPQAGATEGKLEKDGYVWIKTSQGDTSTEAFLKSDKCAVKTADGWKAGTEFQGNQGQGRRRDPAAGLARRLRNFKAPALEVASLVEKVGELKDEGEGVFSGALTEEGVKSLLLPAARPGGNTDGPQISGAKGTAKFWIKDGALVKYEMNTQGKITYNGMERDINRTTTVEFREAGLAKVEVPDEAKKKLE
jgi:hypothetical protein